MIPERHQQKIMHIEIFKVNYSINMISMSAAILLCKRNKEKPLDDTYHIPFTQRLSSDKFYPEHLLINNIHQYISN